MHVVGIGLIVSVCWCDRSLVTSSVTTSNLVQLTVILVIQSIVPSGTVENVFARYFMCIYTLPSDPQTAREGAEHNAFN